ncbi:MAG: methylmalonyl Co-A mutase-associated GTPase MeaB [Bacteroidetes bacterium HGW-Bacteroidetes-21]|nr:MAG: methylmalonyl Co-A mutase-associated GTPase MeaB [Bacteroidetes bacterium HGW-Bacteroidetes-21]
MNSENDKSALKVNPGIPQPPDINPDTTKKHCRKKKALSTKDYVQGILSCNISILSQAITLIESQLHEHRRLSADIINACLPYAGKSIRVGITGVPGVGKSTFIESFGNYVIKQGHKLAVLAIDPSSERSKGSILGDKTRMETLSTNPKAYIRPSPSKGSLGGVAARTREAMILCEAAGFDCIFIETVGVGQSETLVHSMVDFFLLLQLAGAGDELQGIKRGIMEMADAIVITKADGTNARKADVARSQYSSALSLFPMPESGVRPAVLTCSAVHETGIAEVWENIQGFIDTAQSGQYFEHNRTNQQMFWFYETIRDSLNENFFNNSQIKELLPQLEKSITDNKMTSITAANQILDAFFGKER